MSKDTPDSHISVAAVQQCFAPPCVHFIHYYAFYQLRCGMVKILKKVWCYLNKKSKT